MIIHLSNCHYYIGFKGVGMIRVIFGAISEIVYRDIILNTIIRRGKGPIKSTNNESYAFHLYIARL